MKGKKCPACGTVNKVSNIVCSACREDLLRVPVTECDAAPARASASRGGGSSSGQVAGESAPAEGGFRRKCPDCGKLWPYSKTRCECGRSLFTVPVYKRSEKPNSQEMDAQAAESTPEETPVTDAPGEQPTPVGEYNYYLRAEDGKCEIPLPVGEEVVVGRSAAGAEYLKEKAFVSSEHAKFTAYEEGIVIEHIGHTNPTQVNGIELEPNVPYQTQAGDLIVMGVRNHQGYHPSIAYFRLMSTQQI